MKHDQKKFPFWRNASREEISAVFAPFSGRSFLSLAKTCPEGMGNGGPLYCSRNRRTIHPKRRGFGRNPKTHGKCCAICNPRQGRPRKPYNRKKTIHTD